MSTILLFNKAFKGKDYPYSLIASEALKAGYLVHPDCSSREVLLFLTDQKIDLTSTFYQCWDDVTAKSRWELYVDQAAHYVSTYGTNYKGDVYLPDRIEQITEFKNFKIIQPITAEEAIERSQKMLTSGIALSEETLKAIFQVFKQCYHSVNITTIKNKEAKILAYKIQNTLPTDPSEMVRYLVYLTTNKTLLIKDKQTLAAIKECRLDVSGYIADFGEASLSSVFLRFKPIFLALKKSNPAVINRLRRLAVKNHKPNKKGYFEDLLNNFSDIGLLPEKLKELNNFKKITLLEAINLRKTKTEINSYGIRNGKVWIKEREEKDYNKVLDLIYSIIYQSLIDSLKSKACNIKIPKGISIKLPKSEKSFIGNYPIGTSFDLSTSDAIVGINWREVDGARDIDLKLSDISGNHFGWNANYTNTDKTVVYSGDMTSANPEATELFYASNGFKPSIVKANLYNGSLNSKLKFFIAKEELTGKTKQNCMVDSENILFKVDFEMESKEMSLGIITENSFILSKFRTGNQSVAGDSITNKYIQYTLDTLGCYLSLNQVLIDAGFTLTLLDSKIDSKIDLTDLSKDTLISLLS